MLISTYLLGDTSYAALQSGQCCHALADLTGAPTLHLEARRVSFDEIVRWCAAGWSVCASTPEELEEAKSPPLLPPKHSFAVVRAIELRGHREGERCGDRLLLLRNPWGDVEMKGELRTPVYYFTP